MPSALKTITFAHISIGSWYGITTDELKTLNALAVSSEYNRAMCDDSVALINPDKKHIIQCIMPTHTNYADKFSIRALLLVGMLGEEKPQHIVLDISHKKWYSMMSRRSVIG